MAIAWVNSATGTDNTSSTTCAAAAASHTTGNLLVVGVFSGQGIVPNSVADTAGNTYTPLTTLNDAFNGRVRLFYAMNITGNAANVVTATLASAQTTKMIIVEQYSGIATASAFEVQGSATITTGTTVTSSNLVTTTADEVIVACGIIFDGGKTLTADAAMTNRSLATIPTARLSSEDRIVSSTGTYAPTWTLSLSGHASIVAATFKMAAAVAGATPGPVMALQAVQRASNY